LDDANAIVERDQCARPEGRHTSRSQALRLVYRTLPLT